MDDATVAVCVCVYTGCCELRIIFDDSIKCDSHRNSIISHSELNIEHQNVCSETHKHTHTLTMTSFEQHSPKSAKETENMKYSEQDFFKSMHLADGYWRD